MNRQEIRECLETYAAIGPLETRVVYEMADLVDCTLIQLMYEAGSHDRIRALAAVSLLPLCFWVDGYDALEIIAEGTGHGAEFARHALELRNAGGANDRHVEQ